MCVPECSLRELLVQQSHYGELMGHFGVTKTLDILTERFYWPQIRRDVDKICVHCVTYKKAKCKVIPHGLYIPLHIPSEA